MGEVSCGTEDDDAGREEVVFVWADLAALINKAHRCGEVKCRI